MKKTIKDFVLKNKRVIIRCDFNVPIIDGKIIDNTRIKKSLETIKYAVRNNAKVILLSHLGKIKTSDDKAKNDMYIVYQELVKLMKKKIKFVNDTCGEEVNNAVNNLKNGQILLLQNTRYEDLNGMRESNCDLELASYWASLGDIFINDAFGTIHRRHASNYGISKYLESGVGFLIEEELKSMLPTIENPDHPFVVVLGGSKVSDKIKVIENLVTKADYILIGGGMCNTFLLSEGYNMGLSLIDKDNIDFCKNILSKYSDKIILPIDFVVSSEFKDVKGEYRDISDFNDSDIALDIGPKTIDIFNEYIKKAESIIWNGPMGVFEFKNYQNGTKSIALSISENIGTTIVGGGDSVAAIQMFKLESKFSHVSTGGGASLKLLEGEKLPGLENIKDVQEYNILKKKLS